MGNQRRPRQPKAKVVDIETANVDDNEDRVPDDAWWVFVMPNQSNVPDSGVPTQRYGYWESRPVISTDEFGYIISPTGPGSAFEGPVMRIPAGAATSLWVGQMKHTRNPVPSPVEL